MRERPNDRKCVLLWTMGLNLMRGLSRQKRVIGDQEKRDDIPRKDAPHFRLALRYCRIAGEG